MTVKQTRCPFCHSAFYITSLQLNAYRGQARCGQCHQIFVAADHMTSTTPAAELPSVNPSTQIQSPQTELTQAKFLQAEPAQVIEANHSADNIPDQTALFNAATSDSETNASIVATAITPATEIISPSPINDIATQADEPAAVIIVDDPLLLDDKLLDDKPLADMLLADLDLSDTSLTNNKTAPVANKSNSEIMTQLEPSGSVSAISTNSSAEDDSLLFSDEVGYPNEEDVLGNNKSSGIVLDGTFNQNFLDDTFQETDILGQHELTGVEKIHKGADESWLDDLLAEEDVPEIVEELKVEPGNKRPVNINSSAAQAQLSEALAQRAYPTHDEDLLTFLNRTGAVTMPSTQAEKVGYSPNARPASHRILQPTTVKSNPAYFMGWGLMSLLMVGLLGAQYLYFNFEAMAMNPKTSGYMTKMCAIVGCQIPYMDANEILIKNIRLVSNKRSTQTTFRAKITNTAKLSQPFPALQLTLQENGKTVASQIIQPRQYLPNELKTLARLASKNLYPIEFTINTKRTDIDGFELKAQYY